ncbi:MAG: DUF368 domain-containing protein [Firmicutes bacterium]|nr:DUF368 domain-containing protein [Bacillota bacterium]
MKETFILFLKGLIIGIGQIIPGVSGGMLAISLGLYEKGIDAISNFFINVKKNIKFLTPVGIGIITSILYTSKIIKHFLTIYYLPTMLLFIGLIIGGIPSFINKVKTSINKKNIMILLGVFITVTTLSLFKSNNNISFDSISVFEYITLFIVGIIYAATMVIPGVSGTAIMMLIGYYGVILDLISNLTNISYTISNINIALPIMIGFIFGIIVVSRMMNYLLKNHEEKTNFGIIGLVLSSVFIMFIKTFNNNNDFNSVIIGVILLFIGYIISNKLDTI